MTTTPLAPLTEAEARAALDPARYWKTAHWASRDDTRII